MHINKCFRFLVIGLAWDDRETSTGASVGEVVPNCEAMLVDTETEVEITKGYERGELWVRGPNVMKGYWRNPQATQATISHDGWIKTGDIAYVDDQNKFFIVDRKKVPCRLYQSAYPRSHFRHWGNITFGSILLTFRST